VLLSALVFCAIDIVIVKHTGYLTLLDRCPAAAVNIGDMLQICFRCVIMPLTGVMNYVFCIKIIFTCHLTASACNLRHQPATVATCRYKSDSLTKCPKNSQILQKLPCLLLSISISTDLGASGWFRHATLTGFNLRLRVSIVFLQWCSLWVSLNTY